MTVKIKVPAVVYQGFAYEGSRKIAYKQAQDAIGGRHTLNLHVFTPADWTAADRRPVLVMFHGGGWNRGEPGRHVPVCQYAVSRGMVVITAEYRVGQRQGTSPVECVEGAKSAIRYVRRHAAKAVEFAAKLKAAGVARRVFIYAGVNHPMGPPKPGRGLDVENDYLRQADLFLVSLGWLTGASTLPARPDLLVKPVAP